MADGSWVFSGSNSLDYTSQFIASGKTKLSTAVWVKRTSSMAAWSTVFSIANDDVPVTTSMQHRCDAAYFSDMASKLANSEDRVTDGGAYTIDTWELWVITKESGVTMKVYKNNAAAKNGFNTTTGIFGAFNRWNMASTGAASFIGKMAHAAVWDEILTAQDVLDLYAGANPTAIKNSNLLFYLYDNTELYTGGITLTNTGSVTYDTGDYPTVDAPGGASGVKGRNLLLGVG